MICAGWEWIWKWLVNQLILPSHLTTISLSALFPPVLTYLYAPNKYLVYGLCEALWYLRFVKLSYHDLHADAVQSHAPNMPSLVNMPIEVIL